MENKSHALMAGLFTLLLGLAAVFALFWFGGKKEATVEYVVVTQQNVTGLNPQAQVRYRGIPVGKVREIKLDRDDPGNILIVIDVKEAVPVTKGTVAKLAYQGITGLAHILLEENGKQRELLERDADGNAPRISMRQSLFDELGEAGAGTLKQAQAFFGNASDTLNEENRKTLAKLLVNLEQNTAQLNKILSDERVQKVGQAIARVDKAADTADNFFDSATKLLPRVDAMATKLEHMIGNDSSEGVMATLSHVNALSNELSATANQLNHTLRALEQAPESFIFGAPPPRPGPGEPGFAASGTTGKKP